MPTFSARLEECASRVGSKVKLAEQAGISFSQLMRYLNGSSKPTVPRLVALADAAAVTPGWLLSGDEIKIKDSSQLVLGRDVFLKVLQSVENTLHNSQRQITPYRKSMFIFALSKAAEDMPDDELSYLLSGPAVNEMLDFLSAYNDPELDELYKAIEEVNNTDDASQAKRWIELLSRGHKNIYSTPAGEEYFARMLDVEGQYAGELKQIINKAEALNPHVERFLDLGCGNGRHLKFLRKAYPSLRLFGVDAAQESVNICLQLEAKKQLEKGTITKADMRQLPFEDQYFDLIMARHSLMALPLVQKHQLGLDEAFAEVYRILKPGGVFHGVIRRGAGISYTSAYQSLDIVDIQHLAQRHGFDVIGLKLGDLNVDLHTEPADKMHTTVSQYVTFQFIKPLKR